VGICAAIDRVVRGPWDEEVAFIQRTYVAALGRAGALVIVFPPSDDDGVIDPLLDRVDGLILAGGADIDPATYGAEADPNTTGTWPKRDRFEVAMARRAIERGMPLLGVCRGMQLLNVTGGGTLVQHLPDLLGNDAHRIAPGVFGEHDVRLEPGSLAAHAAGAERTTVKSHHHQAIERLGEGLVATGWSEPGNVIEAIELAEHPSYALGVLWHPEEDAQSRVIESLVDAARERVAA
jgi:putative glutamine amidotransferase